MTAKLIGTSTKGIYRRHADGCARGDRCKCPYVIVYRGADGRQKKRSFDSADAARKGKNRAMRDVQLIKAHRKGDHRDGAPADCPECLQVLADRDRDQPTLHEYLKGWMRTYQGTGRRGYRPETRTEDERLLNNYALRYFPADIRLCDVKPNDIAGFVGWLCDGREQAKRAHQIAVERAGETGAERPAPLAGDATRELADSTVRNALKPLRRAMAVAVTTIDGFDTNPARDVELPRRDKVVDDEEHKPRPFPNGTMEMVISIINPKYRLMFELLAATGIRRSELLGLRVRDMVLDGDRPQVLIRQRVRRQRGNGLVIGPLKSKHARRDLPIEIELADKLRPLVAGRDANDLVFTSTTGTIMDPDNVHERVLRPACAEAGVEWAGFHTFRHTVASRMFDEGRKITQVQKWLGHHSPSFTLDTYVHLLDADDLGGPLANKKQPAVQTTSDTEIAALCGDSAD